MGGQYEPGTCEFKIYHIKGKYVGSLSKSTGKAAGSGVWTSNSGNLVYKGTFNENVCDGYCRLVSSIQTTLVMQMP